MPQGSALCQVVSFGGNPGRSQARALSWDRRTTYSGREAAEISSLNEAIETRKEQGTGAQKSFQPELLN